MVTDVDVVLAIAEEHGMLAALAAGRDLGADEHDRRAGIVQVEALVEAERPDVVLLDAPVSGSKEPAEQGQLTIFASGPRAVRPRLGPLFEALGRRTIWVGPVGTGSSSSSSPTHGWHWRLKRSTPR